MRRLLTRVVLSSLAAAGLSFLGPVAARADTHCEVTDPQIGQCLISAAVPGVSPNPGDASDHGPKDTGSGHACYWDPAKQGLSGPPAGPVPCSSQYGHWSNSHNCYIRAAHPQPPAGDPGWQGHEPGDGAVYQCYQPQTDILVYIWSQDPPASAAAGPTPQEVAQMAIDQMTLRAIDIGIAPEPGPNSVGLVGMPVWMWVRNPDSHTYGPATASASAGGITVTATARVHMITWDLGDGTKVVCQTAGTPYQTSYGMRKSPDCGHVYAKSSAHQPSGKFIVSATSDWVITWEGAGQTGTILVNGLTRSVEIVVGEAQVLVE
jgi:hypothetical protein